MTLRAVPLSRLLGIAEASASGIVPGGACAQDTQDRLIAGPVFLYHDEADVRGLGGYMAIPVPGDRDLRISPSFVWYFADDDLMEANADVLYATRLAEGVPVRPFVLGGLGVTVDWGENNAVLGLNAGGGLRLRASDLEAGVGAKIELREGIPVVYFARLGLVIF